MVEKNKKTYPTIPISHWWKIRNKFKDSIPTSIDVTYLTSVLDMQESSAKSNVSRCLKMIGLIDENSKIIEERARKWRDDEDYPKVCEQIKKEIYPKGLIEAFPNPASDIAGVKRWFSQNTGGGKETVRTFTQFYLLLSEADPSKASEIKAKKAPKRKGKKEKKDTVGEKIKEVSGKEKTIPEKKQPSGTEYPKEPIVHIDIQIHISAETSSDQIDKIFESMAKHIYRK